MTNFSINGTYLSSPVFDKSHLLTENQLKVFHVELFNLFKKSEVMYIDQECRLVRLKLTPCLVWCVMPIKKGTSGSCAALLLNSVEMQFTHDGNKYRKKVSKHNSYTVSWHCTKKRRARPPNGFDHDEDDEPKFNFEEGRESPPF